MRRGTGSFWNGGDEVGRMENGKVGELIERTLNRVDARLVDHGRRVAYLVLELMERRGGFTQAERQRACALVLLHDVGAYKTEEIDNMVVFETGSVWEHAAYGYLFLRELSPLGDLAPAVLFHHLDYDRLQGLDVPCRELAQMIYLADRVDIYLENCGLDLENLRARLVRASGTRFSPRLVELFLAAEEARGICAASRGRPDPWALVGAPEFSEEEAGVYLRMLIYTIDFRSRHTVTHTITTTVISREIARQMGVEGEALGEITYGAMLHDLGKIGIPVEILEFPGKLSPQAMRVMRTHVALTEEIIGECVSDRVAQIALRHHEKLDGSGYPRGLTGERLTPAQRIVAVADIVSALSGTRSYKEAFPREKTVGIVGRMAGEGLIDSRIVSVLVEHYDEIMEQVRESSRPVLETYRRMQEEYCRLMERLPALG